MGTHAAATHLEETRAVCRHIWAQSRAARGSSLCQPEPQPDAQTDPVGKPAPATPTCVSLTRARPSASAYGLGVNTSATYVATASTPSARSECEGLKPSANAPCAPIRRRQRTCERDYPASVERDSDHLKPGALPSARATPYTSCSCVSARKSCCRQR